MTQSLGPYKVLLALVRGEVPTRSLGRRRFTPESVLEYFNV